MSGFLSRAFAAEQRSVSLTSPEIIKLLASGQESYTGETITVEGALNVTSVLAGFTILMEDIASLPLILYRRLERGKERANRHPYYSLLHDNFNPEHTSMVFREMVTGHMLGWGNFYGQMLWDGRGVVREIWPLAANRMEVFRKDGERRYLYIDQSGRKIAFRQEDILHIPAFGFDGLVGYSRISMSRNAIGLARAAEKYGSKIFANDARPSVLFKATKKMTPEAKQALRESWAQIYAGAGNAAKSAVLEEGIDIETIGFPPEDAQFLQTRQFQVSEIARIFRIPPHMLGDVERSTSWGSGIEQQEIGYLSHTLRPWLVRIEQQLHKDLLIQREKRNYVIEHLVEALLRTDLTSRMQAYTQAITNGIMNRNEVREKENLNPYDEGEDYLVPMNLKNVNEPEPEPEPIPPQLAPTMLPPNEPPPDEEEEPEDENDERFLPLVMDAARRALRRESHEVRDASRRWLAKGKPEKFRQWLEEFYKADQPQYLREVCTPLIEAGLLGQQRLAHVAAVHSEAQGLRVDQTLAEQGDLEEITEAWPEGAPVLARALMDPAGAGQESE